MPPNTEKKSPALQRPANSTEFVDAPGFVQSQATIRSTRANPQGIQSNLEEENEPKSVTSVGDQTKKSPAPSGSRSKSANNRKAHRNKLP